MRASRVRILGLCLTVLGLATAGATHAEEASSSSSADQCQALASADFSRITDAPTQITATKQVPATSRSVAYCKVEGYIYPEVGFELRLPASLWNGKLIEVGCAGWCGSLHTFACNGPLMKGYACIASDLGHKGTVTDALWADRNLQALIDFGYRGTHVTVLAGKAIAAHFYSKPASRSYFLGCSTGGYQGVTSAQRFPWDFDGIVAGAPDIDGAAASLRVTWTLRTMLDDSGRPRLTRDDLQLVHRAALARCDRDDGLADDVIGNPLACHVDTKALLCRSGESEHCLTAAKADIVDKLYAGPMTSKGERLSTGGLLPGSELHWGEVWPEESVEQFFRYAIPGYSVPAGWKYRDFDFDRDYQRLGLTAYYDNSNPDLRKLKQSGAKLIVYHGGTDTIDLPGAMTDYYDTVERTMGGRKATQDFFRLFLIPGMNHCGGGKGAFAVDWLSVLEAWVERGQAPDVVMSAHVSDDYLRHGPIDLPPSFPADLPPEQRAGIAAFFLEYPLGPDVPLSFTRPIYAYPLFAKYRGSGDPDDASNFRAAHP